VSQKWVLDSFALLAYLKMEGKFSKIKSHLSSHDSIVLMNEISIGETYYILARERSLEKADYFITTILSNLPIRHMSNTFQDVIEAARIKATHSISFADCFTVATAIREKALVVTGDPEFKKVEHFVEIDWI
jgi:predicted nucleic acid-binding protein